MVTRGRECREEIAREFGIDVYTLLYLKRTQGTLLNAMWQPGREGDWGRVDICICMLSPSAVHLELSQHC